jgi:hypothetical protein
MACGLKVRGPGKLAAASIDEPYVEPGDRMQ